MLFFFPSNFGSVLVAGAEIFAFLVLEICLFPPEIFLFYPCTQKIKQRKRFLIHTEQSCAHLPLLRENPLFMREINESSSRGRKQIERVFHASLTKTSSMKEAARREKESFGVHFSARVSMKAILEAGQIYAGFK